MFRINKTSIKQGCFSGSVYSRGLEYYRQNRVGEVDLGEDMNVRAVVRGSRRYEVHLRFTRDGHLFSSQCSCPANNKYLGHCKHIVAVLLFLLERKDNGSLTEWQSKRIAKEIFGFFSQRTPRVKTPIELEVSLDLQYRAGYVEASLSFRMGEDKLYVVRSIPKVLEAMDKRETMEFGRNFTFDPCRHVFQDGDDQLIRFMKEVYEVQEKMEENQYGFRASGLFKDKYMYLTPELMRRFLSIMTGRSFHASVMGTQYHDMRVVEGELPVQFTLDKAGDELVLEVQIEKPLIGLTPGGEYLLIGKRIYHPLEEQVQSLSPFLRVLERTQNNKIHFLREDRERFVAEVLPFAEKMGKVRIQEDVQSVILREDLLAQIYLERVGEGIGAEVKFLYGERIINPYDNTKSRGIHDDRILVRDMDKERTILHLMERYGFEPVLEGAALEDEDKIFEFLYTGIPQLQEHAEIYYSEDFKKMVSLRGKSSYSVGVRLSSGNNFLEFEFHMDGVDPSEFESVFRALKEKKKYYRLKDGTFLPLDSQELLEVDSLLEHMELKPKDLKKAMIQIPKYRAAYLDEKLKESGIGEVRRNRDFRELVEDIKNPGDIDVKLPPSLEGILRDYQRFGFRWLKTLSVYQMGGILADDMGLGKTLQMIALFLHDQQEKGKAPSLVIAPTSLVYNWEAEIEKFAPQLKTVVISGNKEERMEKMKALEEYDVVITSYPLIRRDIDDYEQRSFRYCVLDEAQHIKNPNSLGAKAVKSIQAQNRFALTGTPMENSLTELWSIFDFAMPGYLFSHSKFLQRYERPIVRGQDKKASRELARQIGPFILRRLKKDVLKELPEKIEHKMVAELTDDQKKLYLAYLMKIKGEINREIEEKGFEKSHIKILSGLTRLRQLCCHPGLFVEDYHGESGKMQLLQEVIEESLESNHRILLFSQFTSMLEIIRQQLDMQKVGYLYLDGATPAQERGRLVKAFNEGEGAVFLISLKAGGTGLNLTGADTVIHFDPWWNPAVEEQATDRAYRIGQENVVHVIKFITKGTIEEKIFSLQEKKKELINAVIQPGETLLTKMSEDEVRSLLTI